MLLGEKITKFNDLLQYILRHVNVYTNSCGMQVHVHVYCSLIDERAHLMMISRSSGLRYICFAEGVCFIHRTATPVCTWGIAAASAEPPATSEYSGGGSCVGTDLTLGGGERDREREGGREEGSGIAKWKEGKERGQAGEQWANMEYVTAVRG